MKFHIQKHLESFLVKERVPTEYRKLALSCESHLEDTCTLITGCFTAESVELLNEVDAVILSLSEGHWTDASKGHSHAHYD